MSWPKTLADAPEICGTLLAKEYPTDQPLPAAAMVYTPCCGMRSTADSVIDLRGLDGTTAKVRGRGRVVDLDWACGGCYDLIVWGERGNGWTRSNLARALGAPAHAIKQLRAEEMAQEARAEAERSGKAVSPLAEIRRALASLPDGRRSLPGTDAPPRGLRRLVHPIGNLVYGPVDAVRDVPQHAVPAPDVVAYPANK
jgi:hypothetical protein